MKDYFAGTLVEEKLFCILDEFIGILWKIMGLGNRVCSGSIVVHHTDSMGIGFVEGVNSLEKKMDNELMGGSHRYSFFDVFL